MELENSTPQLLFHPCQTPQPGLGSSTRTAAYKYCPVPTAGADTHTLVTREWPQRGSLGWIRLTTCSLLVHRTMCQELWASLRLFPFLLSFYFVIEYTKCINANGKTFPPTSKLCSLELTYAPLFSCHFFLQIKGILALFGIFFLCNLQQTYWCAADHISLCHFKQEQLWCQRPF